MFLSNASLKRPIAISTIIFAMVVVGAFSYLKLGLDFMPRIDMPYVTVFTVYPGAGPEEVESLVSEIIEDAVSEVDGVKHVRSTSMENISQVFVEFEMGRNVDFAAIDVRGKVDLIKSRLPEDAEDPIILKFDVNAKPVMNLVLVGDRPLNELYDFVNDFVKDQLTKIPGMASVDVIGGKRREIQILVDQNSLAAHGITIMHVVGALAQENIDLPSGHVTEARREYSIRLKGEFDTVEEMRCIDIQTSFGKTIRLTDVAEIRDTFEEQREQASYNGRSCVGLVLKKRADANTVKVVARVKEELLTIRQSLPTGVEIEVVNDDAGFIQGSVSDVIDNMLIGVLLTALILFLFLHNLKETFIAAVSMPASIIATFTLIHFAGFTLNIMSLMALGISIGVLVTNAVVVLENIHRHMVIGDSAGYAAEKGTSEIALAVLGSTLTNVVVFLPIAFMSGLVGQFFLQFGLTVTFATVVSLLISFTLTPILSAKLLKPEDVKPREQGMQARFFRMWDKAYDRFAGFYGKLLGHALRHRWLVIALSVAAFTASMAVIKHLGAEMVTEPDRSELVISVEMPPGTPLALTDNTLTKVEEIVNLEFKSLVTATYVKLGKIEGMFGKSAQGVHLGEVLVLLKDKADRDRSAAELLTEIRQALADVPAATIVVQQTSAIGGAEAPLQIEVSGKDLDTLSMIAEKVYRIVRETPGSADVDTTSRPGKPELSIFPKRQKIKDYGLTVAQIAGILRVNIEGFVATEYRIGDKEHDIRVKLAKSDRRNIDQVKNFLVPLRDGSTILLSQVADIFESQGPTQIIRKNKQRLVIISCNVTDRSLNEVASDIKGQIDKIDFPPGYGVFFGGMVERMEESFGDMLVAFLMAVILTYLVLAALLESYLQPLTIMLTLPLALIGVFLSLYITGKTINIFSMMAMVMLVGIVVNNAILLIDYTTVLRSKGKSREDALLEACPTRLRPIIMTNLATIFGMLPIAVGMGWGAELRSPMAIVTIGGLLVSAVLTMLVIPVVYTFFDDLGGAFGKSTAK
jgi:hydrophobic/amphiphilic exporter-1 (mainly G- bacteria), HAE1 family